MKSDYETLASEETAREPLVRVVSPSPPKIVQPLKTRFILNLLLVYVVVSATLIFVLAGATFYQSGGQRDGIQCRKPANINTTYGRNTSYMSLDHKYDDLWETLDGTSNVIDLPDATQNGQPMPGVLSMIHQLHCLSTFRHAIQVAREGIDPGFDQHDDGHWPHCFDYLRKTILCQADATVERPKKSIFGLNTDIIDGTQDLRQCGDSDAIYKVMRERRKDFTESPAFQ